MKKLLLSITLVAFASVTFAQNFSYGLRLGLDVGALQASAQGINATATTSGHLSSLVEGFADFKLGNFSLQPAIVFTGKGGNVTDGDGGLGQFALHYIEFPLNIVYHVPVSIGNFYVGGGGYVAFGAGGDVSANGPAGVDSEPATFGGSGDFSSGDSGVDFIGGLQLKSGWLFHLSYDLGLSNILNPNGPEGGFGTFKTRTFGASIGFVL